MSLLGEMLRAEPRSVPVLSFNMAMTACVRAGRWQHVLAPRRDESIKRN